MIAVDNPLCTGCAACENACPLNCINMIENKDGFLYPLVDDKVCLNCGLCNKVCPLYDDYRDNTDKVLTETFGAVNSNKDAVKMSSSAGVFFEIAKLIISRGGKVYAALFDDENKLLHRAIEKVEDIHLACGSKYVQSNIGKIYVDIKEKLLSGVEVLFVGTPCQVHGLVSYLKQSYDNLYILDFICHGVPSPKVWKYYLGQINKKFDLGNIREINFRDKLNGWGNYGIRISGDKNEYYALKNHDLYQIAFSRNLTLRDSCYNCNFKGVSRKSDMTLGDLWGGKAFSSLYDEDGTSLITIHTEKGRKLLNEISDEIAIDKIDLTEYLKHHNRSMIESVKRTKRRDKFFDEFNLNPDKVIDILDKHIRKTNYIHKFNIYKNRIVRACKKIIRILNICK